MEDADKKQKARAGITVNEKWCKKCGICIAFCPKGVFVADKFGKPVVKHPEQCIKCMFCVARCPDFAVDVKESAKKPNSE
jgi:2-oxoglutarate ferredoxin oxidoreductase subunit delta